jgi:hypothetical protein
MLRIFSTVGPTIGAQTRAFAPSLSAFTAEIIASSIDVAEYSLMVTSLPPIFSCFHDIVKYGSGCNYSDKFSTI